MNAAELIAALGIGKDQLTRWIGQGLPFTRVRRRREFDPQTVRSWLVVRGLAQNSTVVSTRAEAARALKVNERTLAGWLAAGAPGEPGAYDIDALTVWRADRRQADPLLSGAVSPMLEKYRGERWRLARLERMERQRELVPRALVESWITEVLRGLRACHTTLQRTHGQDAVDIVGEGLRDASDGFMRQWGHFCRTNGLADDLTRIETNYTPSNNPREETPNVNDTETNDTATAAPGRGGELPQVD